MQCNYGRVMLDNHGKLATSSRGLDYNQFISSHHVLNVMKSTMMMAATRQDHAQHLQILQSLGDLAKSNRPLSFWDTAAVVQPFQTGVGMW